MEAMACQLVMQGCTVDELKDKLCSQEGPKVQATQPDYVKFHDDKVGACAGAAQHRSEDDADRCLWHVYVITPVYAMMLLHHDMACRSSLLFENTLSSRLERMLCWCAEHLHRCVCQWRAHKCRWDR